MKKIFTLFVATVTLLSVQAISLNRPVQFKGMQPHAVSAVTANVEMAALDNASFAIAIDSLASASFKAIITPSDANATYYFDITAASNWNDNYNADSMAAEMKDYFEEQIMTYYYYYGQIYTYADFMSKGVDSYHFKNLNPDTEYVVWALGMNSTTCAATTGLDTIHVHTLAGSMSDNVITMAYNNGTMTITTTNSDPYFFAIGSLAEYSQFVPDFSQASANKYAQAYANTLAYYGMLSDCIFSGNQNINVAEFYKEVFGYGMYEMEAGDYVAVAAGYSEYVNTNAALVQFTYAGNTPVENVKADSKAVKAIRNGQVVILRNGVEYNLLGTEVK